jgi:signal transduction histidine kinase
MDREWWQRRPWVLDALVAAVTTGVEIVLVVDGWPSWTPLAIALSVLGGALLLLRRRAPVAVLLGTIAASAALCFASGGGFAGGAPVAVAMFTVAELRERWLAIALLVPEAIVMQWLKVSSPPVGVLAVVAGSYVQTRRGYTEAVEARAAQRERAAIARELHDIVAHSVTVMLLGVRGARDVLRTQPDVADDVLRRVEAGGEASLAELRRILDLLRDPGQAPEAELAPAPSLAQLGDLVGHFAGAGLPVRLEVDGDRRPLPAGLELSVYRIVEEALTNVAKHSRAGDVVVRLRYAPATLEVQVEDDGTPRHPADGTAGTGHGIRGMRERVAALDGELEAGVRPGGGFRVAARLPAGDAA